MASGIEVDVDSNSGPAGGVSSGLAPMDKVAEDLGKWSVDLYVGDKVAAVSMGQLRAHGITSILNCSVNQDVNYVGEALPGHPGGEVLRYGFSPVRVAKVGMIDGPGNHPSLLLAACHALEGLLHQDSPTTANHPPHQPSHVLVHCRARLSRSITVAALYLHGKFPDRWPSFDARALFEGSRLAADFPTPGGSG